MKTSKNKHYYNHIETVDFIAPSKFIIRDNHEEVVEYFDDIVKYTKSFSGDKKIR
jgi:hypothetical protein